MQRPEPPQDQVFTAHEGMDLRANLTELRALATAAARETDTDAIRAALNRVRLSAINAVELCNRIEFEARLEALTHA